METKLAVPKSKTGKQLTIVIDENDKELEHDFYFWQSHRDLGIPVEIFGAKYSTNKIVNENGKQCLLLDRLEPFDIFRHRYYKWFRQQGLETEEAQMKANFEANMNYGRD